MQKKGQVTVFVIVGIVIIVVFALLYVFSKDLAKLSVGTKNTQTRVSEVFDTLKRDQIDRCIDLETKKAVNLFLENGGTFETSNYVTYHTKKINVLCQAIPGKTQCMESPLLISSIESKFNSLLSKKIFDCIDLSIYRKNDINIESGLINVSSKINSKNMVVNVNYPITVKSGIVNFSLSNFVYTVNVPLGELIKVTNDILNSESLIGNFPIIPYQLSTYNKYNIELKTSYPNKFYFVGFTNLPYVLPFAIKGNSRFIQ